MEASGRYVTHPESGAIHSQDRDPLDCIVMPAYHGHIMSRLPTAAMIIHKVTSFFSISQEPFYSRGGELPQEEGQRRPHKPG